MTPADAIPCLVEHGLSPAAAKQKGAMLARVVAAAKAAYGARRDPPAAAFFVPGRVEVLGKHTDYAGGRSLLAAAERGFCLVAWPRRDEQIRVLDAPERRDERIPLPRGPQPDGRPLVELPHDGRPATGAELRRTADRRKWGQSHFRSGENGDSPLAGGGHRTGE